MSFAVGWIGDASARAHLMRTQPVRTHGSRHDLAAGMRSRFRPPPPPPSPGLVFMMFTVVVTVVLTITAITAIHFGEIRRRRHSQWR